MAPGTVKRAIQQTPQKHLQPPTNNRNSHKCLEANEITMCHVSEIREMNKPQPPPGILLSTVPLYNRDETKCVNILLKTLMLCSLEFSIELISLLTHRLQDCRLHFNT